jgi:hypothetical protein
MAAELAAGETLAVPAWTAERVPSLRPDVQLLRAPMPTRIEGFFRSQLIRAPAAQPLRAHRAKTVRAGTGRSLR